MTKDVKKNSFALKEFKQLAQRQNQTKDLKLIFKQNIICLLWSHNKKIQKLRGLRTESLICDANAWFFLTKTLPKD